MKITSPGRRSVLGGPIPNPAKSVKMPKPGRRDYGKKTKQSDPSQYTDVGFDVAGFGDS